MTDTEGVEGSDTTTDTAGTGATGTAGTGATGTTTDTASTGDTAGTTGDADAAAMMGVSGVSPKQYVRASTLLDYDFENTNGDVSGDLEDLLIDLSTGRVLFASIEYGGVLDLGDKDIVVPMNAFAIGEEGELVLNIDEAALEGYPDVGNDWPNLDDPAWDDDVNTYWNDTGVDVGEGFSEASGSVGWASDIIGRNIADLGFGAGSILDILVNLGTGQAPYVIVDHGEGLDTDPYIIPLAAYDVSDWNNEFAYGPDFTPDLIETAPRLDQETYPDGTAFDEDFGDNLESTWNDMGFSNDLNNDGEND
jgi:sporulation protein YlmC with PRC-barrel domain